MKKCLETYRAAADLGSADAEYAVALFHLQGGVVTQDLKEGATRLRAAAEKGSIPARVYLGNMYELGIHYKADPEKADVWYRNAARASKIEAEPGSDEHANALAELGCVRYVLARVETAELDEEEKKHLLARAKAHGYGLKMRDAPSSEPERLTLTEALADVDAKPAPTRAEKPREAKDTAPATPVAKKKTDKPTPSRAGPAIAAFAWAVVFMTAGASAAYAASLGAHELVARGHALPGLEKDVRPVFPIVLAVVGVLPAWLVYRFDALIKAIVVGGVLGGVGWIAWGTGIGKLHAARPVEALAFGIAGFLAALLVFGLLGGTKAASRPTRR
jgi:hypothetical protein